MVLSDLEKTVLAEVSKEKCWRHVEWFASMGEKLSGTPSNEKSVDYILEALAGYGVRATAPEFQAWLDFPRLFDSEVKVLSPIEKNVEAMALAQIASTPPEGLEGELVYAGGGALADYDGKNVRGKIVLVDFDRGPPRPWKNYVAGVLKGATGLIVVDYKGPTRVYNRGTVKSVWGNPTPDNIDEIGRIPVVNISAEDGASLKDLLVHGPMRVWMKASGERGWARTRQPMASLSNGREFVLLGSHMDAWGGAASCNAVGVASTLEAARVLARHLPDLRRGVEFTWFQGHETGIMTGSTWYVDTYWDRLRSGCVAYLNNDTPSMTGTTVYSVGSDPLLRDFVVNTVRELAEKDGVALKPVKRYTPNKTGDQSFLGLGIPSVRVITTFPEEIEKITPPGGWWYHSDMDTIDKVDPETLHVANRAQMLVMLRLCTLPVLPYKVASAASWMTESLSELTQRSGKALDFTELHERAESLEESALQLDEATTSLSVRANKGEDLDPNKLRLVDEGLIAVSRILNPVNYTLHGRYEQDHYGAEYIKPIPALQPVAELTVLNPDTSAYKALRTKLVRARNMVSDALVEANRVVKNTIELAERL
jgi:hypothetical protein